MGILDLLGVQEPQGDSAALKRLRGDLAELREENERLARENRIAVGAKREAIARTRELEDVLRLKEVLAGDYERQIAYQTKIADEYAVLLASSQSELSAIRKEQETFPLSDMDLLHRYDRQAALFESIQEALTCPICYDFFGRGQAVSLLCGHSFCQKCFAEWEEKHLDVFKASSYQGEYTGCECPECRTTGVRRGRVRIWAMEEIVRLVEKGTELAKVLYKPPLPGENKVGEDVSMNVDERLRGPGTLVVSQGGSEAGGEGGEGATREGTLEVDRRDQVYPDPSDEHVAHSDATEVALECEGGHAIVEAEMMQVEDPTRASLDNPHPPPDDMMAVLLAASLAQSNGERVVRPDPSNPGAFQGTYALQDRESVIRSLGGTWTEEDEVD